MLDEPLFGTGSDSLMRGKMFLRSSRVMRAKAASSVGLQIVFLFATVRLLSVM